MERLFKKSFWNAACARAVRTALQGFIASTSTMAMVQDINWFVIGSTTALAVLLSFATSIVAELPEE